MAYEPRGDRGDRGDHGDRGGGQRENGGFVKVRGRRKSSNFTLPLSIIVPFPPSSASFFETYSSEYTIFKTFERQLSRPEV